MPDQADSPSDPFFDPYDRDEIAYGDQPSAPVAEFLRQVGGAGKAFDLGAGAGRDSLALAAAGYDVTAIDMSRRGLDRIAERAAALGLQDKIRGQLGDVRDIELGTEQISALVATTVLDHIPAEDAQSLWQVLCDSLTASGWMYIEVHTTEDPGSPSEPGCDSDGPVSETADAVVNYFHPNQLLQWATLPESRLRVLRYEERLEWDYTHGPEHLHGKAILLAIRAGVHPPWFGQPAAFPRQA